LPEDVRDRCKDAQDASPAGRRRHDSPAATAEGTKSPGRYCRGVFRILTYNVRHCRGTDGRVSPARIAEVIASCRPDIVALQELDVGRARTGRVDQAEAIARDLRMHMLFHPSIQVMEEQYGNAILTTRPATLIKAAPLPGRAGLEPRGALWASVQLDDDPFQIINTHLGLRRLERLLQIETLLGPDWLGHPACREPVVLVGDFNALPRSGAYRRLTERLADAQVRQGTRPIATFPSRWPLARLDHVFVLGPIDVMRAQAVRTPLARIASDHLPLVVEFRIARPSARDAVTEDEAAA
jgi:endonuclease/exonuclease/phosphatase family metal-dependent hydrolase